VKFTLTYDGSLPPSANKPKNQAKWDIRKTLHPQFKDLWASHPALREIERDGRYLPADSPVGLTQTHHQSPRRVSDSHLYFEERGKAGDPDIIDLCGAINKHGVWFRPLVRESFALHCGLKILFLRKEGPGKIYQGGNLDGRIKTLLDALTMPQHMEQVLEKSSTQVDPIYCLLEDDSLVSGLDVQSERLLTDENHPADYARLTIEVDVRVRQAMIYNQAFLG
jgi:hypothetical protein